MMPFPQFGHTRQRGFFQHRDVQGEVIIRPATFEMYRELAPPVQYRAHWWQFWRPAKQSVSEETTDCAYYLQDKEVPDFCFGCQKHKSLHSEKAFVDFTGSEARVTAFCRSVPTRE
jgi:hypothetical protein